MTVAEQIRRLKETKCATCNHQFQEHMIPVNPKLAHLAKCFRCRKCKIWEEPHE